MWDEFRRDEGVFHFERGLVLERANRIAEAVEEYRQAIASYPYLREAHAALGCYYQRRGMLAKAADAFHTVANLEGDFLAYFNLAYVLVELERYDDALVAFQQCLQFEPDDPATHYKIATIYFVLSEFQAALEHLQPPLQSYPNDWEIHDLMGKCYLALQRYDEATAAFNQALHGAYTLEEQTELLERMLMVERYREFGSFDSAKDLLYAEDGVVYLGSAQDNGLVVTEVDDYHFTYPDIGITLQRLKALLQSQFGMLTAVVAVDKHAYPLASALSTMLAVPSVQITDLQLDDTALFVLAAAREVEMLLLALEHAPCPGITFCLGLNWRRYSKYLPDIIGIVARGACSVPWEPEVRRLRADGASLTAVQACLEQAAARTLHAVQETPSDANLRRQVCYYTHNHRRLNFPFLP